MPIFELGPEARVWLFVFETPVIGEQLAIIRRAVEAHLAGWNSHGVPVQGAYEVLFDRFLVVGGIVDAASPSGCSIDSLFRAVRSAGDAVGIRLLPPSYLSFRTEYGVRSVTREEFRELARSGEITSETSVFDTSISTVAALQEWERPLRESWHRELVDSI